MTGFVAGVANILGLIGLVVSWGMWSEGGIKRWGSISVTIALIVTAMALGPAPRSSGGSGENCYTDWDGRSNPTVCD